MITILSAIAEKELKALTDWEENEHPRHSDGRFAPKGDKRERSSMRESSHGQESTAVSRYQQRLVNAYDRLAKEPIALRYIPKDFVGIEDVGKLNIKIDGYSDEELEKIPGIWEENSYAVANEAYWDYVELAEDGDVMLDVEIDLGHVNSEDELEKWEDELTEKYPELMRMID